MPGPLLCLLLPLHALILLRSVAKTAVTGTGGPVRRGLCDALRGLPELRRKRRQVQAQRRVGWLTLARALSWSPGAIRRRAIVLRP